MRALVLLDQPLPSRPVLRWLHDVDERPLLIASRRAVAPVPETDLRRDFERVVVVGDYKSFEPELRAIELHREIGYDGIAMINEFDVLRAARLREFLHLSGQSTRSALAYRDKVVMKDYVARAGLRVPPYRGVDQPLDLLEHCRAHGYPVVVKPRRLAGSIDVSILPDADAVSAFLASGQLAASQRPGAGRWMAEAFVPGELHHVDGLMVGGRVVHAWPATYLAGNLDTVVSGRSCASAMLDENSPWFEPLMRLARDVVAALPATPEIRSFHLEAFVGDGEPVLCEIACRTGGGGIVAGHELTFGVNLSGEAVRGQAGLPAMHPENFGSTPGELTGWILFPSQQGVLTSAPETCPMPGVVDYRVDAKPGDVRRSPAHVSDSVGRCLVRAPDAEQLWQRVVAADEWWHSSVQWAPLETAEVAS